MLYFLFRHLNASLYFLKVELYGMIRLNKSFKTYITNVAFNLDEKRALKLYDDEIQYVNSGATEKSSTKNNEVQEDELFGMYTKLADPDTLTSLSMLSLAESINSLIMDGCKIQVESHAQCIFNLIYWIFIYPISIVDHIEQDKVIKCLFNIINFTDHNLRLERKQSNNSGSISITDNVLHLFFTLVRPYYVGHSPNYVKNPIVYYTLSKFVSLCLLLHPEDIHLYQIQKLSNLEYIVDINLKNLVKELQLDIISLILKYCDKTDNPEIGEVECLIDNALKNARYDVLLHIFRNENFIRVAERLKENFKFYRKFTADPKSRRLYIRLIEQCPNVSILVGPTAFFYFLKRKEVKICKRIWNQNKEFLKNCQDEDGNSIMKVISKLRGCADNLRNLLFL